MSFEQIKKRNGSIVAFDKQRIADAILKASLSVDGEIEIERINELTDAVVDNLAALHIDATPDVESIQDLIEQELMRGGFFQTARSYIVYREQHKKQRQTEQQEQVAKLEKSGISVIDSKGKTEKFDPKKLEKTILRFTNGLENVDAAAVMESVKTKIGRAHV